MTPFLLQQDSRLKPAQGTHKGPEPKFHCREVPAIPREGRALKPDSYSTGRRDLHTLPYK
eukprot:538689-Amphidinium_carterae.1